MNYSLGFELRGGWRNPTDLRSNRPVRHEASIMDPVIRHLYGRRLFEAPDSLQAAIERRKRRVEERKEERKDSVSAEAQEEARRAAKVEDDNWMFKWATDEAGNELQPARSLAAEVKGGEAGDIGRKVPDGDLEYDEDEEKDYEDEGGDGEAVGGVNTSAVASSVSNSSSAASLAVQQRKPALNDTDVEYDEEEDEDYEDDEGEGAGPFVNLTVAGPGTNSSSAKPRILALNDTDLAGYGEEDEEEEDYLDDELGGEGKLDGELVDEEEDYEDEELFTGLDKSLESDEDYANAEEDEGGYDGSLLVKPSGGRRAGNKTLGRRGSRRGTGINGTLALNGTSNATDIEDYDADYEDEDPEDESFTPVASSAQANVSGPAAVAATTTTTTTATAAAVTPAAAALTPEEQAIHSAIQSAFPDGAVEADDDQDYDGDYGEGGDGDDDDYGDDDDDDGDGDKSIDPIFSDNWTVRPPPPPSPPAPLAFTSDPVFSNYSSGAWLVSWTFFHKSPSVTGVVTSNVSAPFYTASTPTSPLENRSMTMTGLVNASTHISLSISFSSTSNITFEAVSPAPPVTLISGVFSTLKTSDPSSTSPTPSPSPASEAKVTLDSSLDVEEGRGPRLKKGQQMEATKGGSRPQSKGSASLKQESPPPPPPSPPSLPAKSSLSSAEQSLPSPARGVDSARSTVAPVVMDDMVGNFEAEVGSWGIKASDIWWGVLGTLALLVLLVISTYVGRAMLDMARNEMPMDKRRRNFPPPAYPEDREGGRMPDVEQYRSTGLQYNMPSASSADSGSPAGKMSGLAGDGRGIGGRSTAPGAQQKAGSKGKASATSSWNNW